jgi:hypothetical protein
MMPLALQAQTNGQAGTVHVIRGVATATSEDGDIRRIRKGSDLYSNETITTTSGSYARLKLKDESWIMLRPGSRFYLESVEFDDDTGEGQGFFSLLKGGFRAVTGLIKDKLNYRYSTTVATIGIRGTDFMARICNGDCLDIYPPPENGLYLEVVDNEVVIDNASGKFRFRAGQYVFLSRRGAVPRLLDFRPDVFVQSPIPVADPADCIQ